MLTALHFIYSITVWECYGTLHRYRVKAFKLSSLGIFEFAVGVARILSGGPFRCVNCKTAEVLSIIILQGKNFNLNSYLKYLIELCFISWNIHFRILKIDCRFLLADELFENFQVLCTECKN